MGEVIYVDFQKKIRIEEQPKTPLSSMSFSDKETVEKERADYFRQEFARLFESGVKTRVIVFTKDAKIPDHLKSHDLVALDFSIRFGLTDLQYDGNLSATLSFGGKPHPVVVPWTAVYAVMENK